jgi:DNA-binding NarL/FixJ family response regulator
MARALIVDYTPQIVQLVRAIVCTMNGIKHVDSTGRGDVAAELLRSNDYDLVIIEAVVPHGEERLLAHVAREHPSISSKLIVVTAPPIARAVLRDVEAVRPRAMIEKPFDVLAFATAVRAILPPPETRHIATPYAA